MYNFLQRGSIASMGSFKDQSSTVKGRGGGIAVSVLAFYSNDQSSNPIDYVIFLYCT